MKKMRKSASNVNNAVNLISGAYTLPLIDKLFSNSQRIENMDDVYFAITALVDTDRISEAFHMIRGIVWNFRYGISAGDCTVGKIGRTAGIFCVGIYFLIFMM